MMKISIGISQKYYPETLEKMFIINAPWLFRTIWTIVKGWLHKNTSRKISMHKKVPTQKLLEYIGKSY